MRLPDDLQEIYDRMTPEERVQVDKQLTREMQELTLRLWARAEYQRLHPPKKRPPPEKEPEKQASLPLPPNPYQDDEDWRNK